MEYHVDLSNYLSYNGHIAYDGSPNVVLPMSARLIVDSLTAISPNVCSPNQPLTKRAFIANLTQPTPKSMFSRL